MTTLNQVQLLEEKVEGIVVRLQQLQAENDALRKQCAELTNALSSKSEQLSSYTSDQNEIEDGLKKALDRLNYIENSVLKAGTTTVNPNGQASIQITPGMSGNLSNKPINNQINTPVEPVTPVTTMNFNSMESAPITNNKAAPVEAVTPASPVAPVVPVTPVTPTEPVVQTPVETVKVQAEPVRPEPAKQVPLASAPFTEEHDIMNDQNVSDDDDGLGFDIF